MVSILWGGGSGQAFRKTDPTPLLGGRGEWGGEGSLAANWEPASSFFMKVFVWTWENFCSKSLALAGPSRGDGSASGLF